MAQENHELTTRTQDEILQKLGGLKRVDFFMFEIFDLLVYLTYENARMYQGDNFDKRSWAELDVMPPEQRITEYLPFAWGKANDCRGLSANRSISHLRAWAWLMNDGSYDELTSIKYEYYGKPQLVYMSKKTGVDWQMLDSGLWGNDEMTQENREEVFNQ